MLAELIPWNRFLGSLKVLMYISTWQGKSPLLLTPAAAVYTHGSPLASNLKYENISLRRNTGTFRKYRFEPLEPIP